MHLYLLLLLFFLALISWRRNKNVVNPGTIFPSIWFVIILFFSLRLVEFFPVNDYTFIVIGTGVLFFCIGCFFAPRKGCPLSNYELNIKVIIVLQVVSILVYYSDALESVNFLISGGNLKELRDNMDVGQGRASGLISILKNFILSPFLFLSAPLISFIFISPSYSPRKSIFIFLLGIVILGISIVRLGGRVQLFYLLISIFVIYYTNRNHYTIQNYVKKSLAYIVIFAVIVFIMATISRGIEDIPISLYEYLTCCVPLLNEGISSTTIYLYGVASFSSLLSLVDTIIRFIGGPSLEVMPIIDYFAELTDEVVTIGPSGQHSNAFYSIFYWFYVDYGFSGIIILSFIYGLLSGWVYRMVIRYHTPIWNILFALVFQGVAFSFIRFQFSTVYYFYAFVILPLVIKRKSK